MTLQDGFSSLYHTLLMTTKILAILLVRIHHTRSAFTQVLYQRTSPCSDHRSDHLSEIQMAGEAASAKAEKLRGNAKGTASSLSGYVDNRNAAWKIILPLTALVLTLLSSREWADMILLSANIFRPDESVQLSNL